MRSIHSWQNVKLRAVWRNTDLCMCNYATCMCARTHTSDFEEEETLRHLVKASLWGSMSLSSPREQCFLCHTQSMCVFYLCVCDVRWGRWLHALDFFVQDIFFNVYSKWVHSSQCLTSASLLFKMLEKVATCAICMYKCVCVLGWIQQWHQLSVDTSPNGTQGHKGTRAQGLSSGRPFPKPQGPLGSTRRIGPGRVWWDLLMFVAGDTH